jgi:DNA-binding NarL/FixJ family response regulator
MTIANHTLGAVINKLGCMREKTTSITISNQDLMRASNSYGLSPYLAPVDHRILDLQKRGKTAIEIAHALELSTTEVSNRLEAINRKIKPNESCGNNFAPTHSST